MKKITIAKIMSAVASVWGAIALYCAITNGAEMPTLAALGMGMVPLLSLISYILCGFWKAVCTPFSFAKWGILLGPIPINFAMMAFLFVFGLLAVIYLPFIPVVKRSQELGC